MVNGIIKFFDRLEDHIRGFLSHYPIPYGIIGGAAVVLFWRGVWHGADEMDLSSGWSIVISVIVLLSTGLLVSAFIGDQVIISGLRHEKKLAEKTEEEVEEESGRLVAVRHELKKISDRLESIEKRLGEK